MLSSLLWHIQTGGKTKKRFGRQPMRWTQIWGLSIISKPYIIIICNIYVYISFFLSFRFACHIVDTHGRAELCWPRSIIAGENQPGAGVYIICMLQWWWPARWLFSGHHHHKSHGVSDGQPIKKTNLSDGRTLIRFHDDHGERNMF